MAQKMNEQEIEAVVKDIVDTLASGIKLAHEVGQEKFMHKNLKSVCFALMSLVDGIKKGDPEAWSICERAWAKLDIKVFESLDTSEMDS